MSKAQKYIRLDEAWKNLKPQNRFDKKRPREDEGHRHKEDKGRHRDDRRNLYQHGNYMPLNTSRAEVLMWVKKSGDAIRWPR